MAKELAKLLKTDIMADLDMAALAQILRSRGRGNDKVLAHITPKEAALLKKRGGAGTINPDTGLPEFDDGVDSPPIDQPAPTVEQPSAPTADVSAPSEISAPSTDASVGGQYAPQLMGEYGGPQVNIPSPAPTAPSQYAPEFMGEYGGPQTGSPEAVASNVPPDKPKQPGLIDKALQQLTQPGNLAKLGLAGGLGAYGAYQSSQAGKQAAAATTQKQAMAAPLQQQGQQMMAQANAGQLTPANQQLIQAQRARLQQASVNMGGVGQQQIESQISNLSNQLLQNQYQYGLQVLQIGDNIAIGAINSQLQIDNQLAAANKSFYSSLANLVAGSPNYVQGMVPVTPPKA